MKKVATLVLLAVVAGMLLAAKDERPRAEATTGSVLQPYWPGLQFHPGMVPPNASWATMFDASWR